MVGRDITDGIYNDAYELGKLLAKEGYLVYCGGTCVGILKGQTLDEMNEYVHIPLATNMGITRNSLLAYNCDAAVAVSGHYGTLSEIAYAKQLEKPIVGLHSWEIDGLDNVESPHEVIQFLKEHT